MKKTAFYHIYLTDDPSWTYVFLDQFKNLNDTGLDKELETVYISSVGSRESTELLKYILGYHLYLFNFNYIHNWVEKSYDDVELRRIDKSPTIVTEDICLNLLWNFCKKTKENQHILYFHSKGITSLTRNLNINSVEYSPVKFVNYFYWRKFLDWSVMDKKNDCWKALEMNDTAGSNFSNWPTKHYSGGYWWANSEYIKTLNDPYDDKWWNYYREINPALKEMSPRLRSELWIGSGKSPKMYSLFNHKSPPPKSNLGDTIITKKEYVAK